MFIELRKEQRIQQQKQQHQTEPLYYVPVALTPENEGLKAGMLIFLNYNL